MVFKNTRLYLALIIVTGFLLRIYQLTSQSFWLDEIFTTIDTDPSLSIGEVYGRLKEGKITTCPPLYFICINLWCKVWPFNDYWIRFPSAIFGSLAIYAMYLLGKELVHRQVGLWASLMMAVNIFLIKYSQEARPYALLTFLTVFSFILLVRFLRKSGLKYGIIYTIVLTCLLYTHQFGIFILFSQAIITLFYYWKHGANYFNKFLIKSLLPYVLSFLFFIPWISALVDNYQRLISGAAQKPEPSLIYDLLKQYFEDNHILIFMTIMAGCFFFIKMPDISKYKNPGKEIKLKNELLPYILVISWLFVVFMVVYALTYMKIIFLHNRYTIILVPAIFLLIGMALYMFESRYKAYAFVTLFSMLSVFNIIVEKNYYFTPYKGDWRNMAAFVMEHNQINTPVFNPNTTCAKELYDYYFRQSQYKASYIDQETLENDTLQTIRQVWLLNAAYSTSTDPQFNDLISKGYRVEKERFFSGWCSAKLLIKE